MSISKEQAIEAIKTLKEYCNGRGCLTCELKREWCDGLLVAPGDWEVPND